MHCDSDAFKTDWNVCRDNCPYVTVQLYNQELEMDIFRLEVFLLWIMNFGDTLKESATVIKKQL